MNKSRGAATVATSHQPPATGQQLSPRRLALPASSAAALAAQDARQIVAESQRRGRADSQRYEGSLEVISANNKVSKKHWQSDRLGSYGNSKAIIRFTEPAEVKGVALLVVNHPERSSDQWMWTPAIGRDRRIAQQDRSTRFFGTDFSFEDLEERDVDQFDFSCRARRPSTARRAGASNRSPSRARVRNTLPRASGFARITTFPCSMRTT